MRSRSLICIGLLLTFEIAGSVGRTITAAERPNIVVILADDMGYGDPSCYGGSKIPTRAIDRLAADGMRFTDAHSPGAVCVPTRYGLMTGRYPFRADLPWRRKSVIDSKRLTIAQMLQQSGYQTECVGKWHLGFETQAVAASPQKTKKTKKKKTKTERQRPNVNYAELVGGPCDRGFDHYFGLPHSLDIEPYFLIRDRAALAAPTQKVEANSTEGWTPIQGAFWREGLAAPDFRHEEVLPRVFSEAQASIKRLATTEKPFFLYVALPAPHTPWIPLKPFQGKSQAGMYGDFVVQVDQGVGQLMEALDAAKVADNTLVVFTSDNGPVWYPHDTQRFQHSATGPLRGMKGDAFEGGHRVPFIVRWPTVTRPGSVSQRLVCQTDLFATFADILKRKLPDASSTAEDSVSIAPTLRGESQRPRSELAIVSSGGFPTLRDGPWKLIVGIGSGGFTSPRKIKPEKGQPTVQLYNLDQDLAESKNLAAAEPARVKAMLAAWADIQDRRANLEH